MQNSSTSSKIFLKRVTQITETNLSNEHFGVSELAWEMGISRSSLHRKIKKLTNNSASRFICKIRLEKALKLIQQNNGTISEIAYSVGFKSPTYFSKCFHDYFGISPLEAKNGIKTLNPGKKESSKRIKSFLILTPLILILLFTAFAVYQSFQKDNAEEEWLMILTPDNEKTGENVTPLINGLQHKIRKNLNELNQFNVVSETTSMNYSKMGFDMKKIAKNGIDYVLLFQPIVLKDKITLYVELTDTHTRQPLLNEPYELNQISGNIFGSIEEITLAITAAIQEKTSPQKDENFSFFSTTNKAANYNFNLGLNYLANYQYKGLEKNLYQSKQYFKKAIEQDTLFAAAYTRLGFIYICLEHDLSENPKEANFLLDSGRVYLEKALNYNPHQSWAWSIKNNYYVKKGKFKIAEKCLHNVYKFRNSDHEYYLYRLFHAMYKADYFQILDCFCQYNKLKPTEDLVMPRTLKAVIWALSETGFNELALQYAQQLYEIEKDSAALYQRICTINMLANNFITVEKTLESELEKNRTNTELLELLISTKFLTGKNEEAKINLEKLKKNKTIASCNVETNLIDAFYRYNSGQKMEASSQLFKIIERETENINYHTTHSLSGISQVYIAAAYSIMGDNEKAMSYLNLVSQRESVTCCVLTKLKKSPFYNTLRDDNEFNQLVERMENTYQSQHKKIEMLIKKNTLFSNSTINIF